MIGIDNLIISFAVSLAANITTNIITAIRDNTTIENRIAACFSKALNEWKKSQRPRDGINFDDIKKYTDLEHYMSNSAQGIDSRINELLQLWASEMQNDETCYKFILSIKTDITNQKIDIVNQKQDISTLKQDETLSILKNELAPQIAEISKNSKLTSEVVQQIISQIVKSSADEKLATQIENILRDVVVGLIESLRLDSARSVICELEIQFSKCIEKYSSLKAHVCFRKAQALRFTDPENALKLRHQAYTIDPANKEYIRSEILLLISKKNYESAEKLVEKLYGGSMYLHLIEVLNAEDKEAAYKAVPDNLKNDYEFNEILLERFQSDDPKKIGFLFHDDVIVTPSSFTFSTLSSWLFAVSLARARWRDCIVLSFDAPQIKDMYPYLEVMEDFYNKLLQTEVRDFFPIVKAIYSYWKYLATKDNYWLNEFQKIEKKQYGEQRSYFEMVESSMLFLAGRHEEAFTLISGADSPVDNVLIIYVVMLSAVSNNIMEFRWILDKAKGESIKLNGDVALYIAKAITKEKAQEIKNIISDSDFENPADKSLLIQLCNFFSGNQIDCSIFKKDIDTLNDEMKAYAANILAYIGDTQLAYDMLRPIVDETVPDFKQNVYLSVLEKMVEKRPELYNILVENRKHGNYCGDNLLSKEYLLDIRISDYENALEAITELYQRHPDDIWTFANYVFALGHVNPKQLIQHENKALSLHLGDMQLLVLIYRAFSENGYLNTAAEILYQAAKASEDQGLRTFFHNEAITGLIRSVVSEEKEASNEGDYVLCDIAGKKVFYKATKDGSTIGEAVLGVSKDNVIETEINLTPVILTIKGIHNKYYKLAYDIMRESGDGSNPYLTPIPIDMEHPLESLEKAIQKISGNEQTPEEQRKQAYVDYENGNLALLNLVNDSNPLAGYYKLLFTPFKVYVNCSVVEIKQMPSPTNESLFVLDIPTIITFAEFTAKTGLVIKGPMVVTTIHKDLVDTTNKAILKFLDPDFYEAMVSGHLVKYSDHVDEDAMIHIQKLSEWIKNNCKVVIPDAALAMIEDLSNSSKTSLLSSIAMLTKPAYYYVTDDIRIKLLMPDKRIIGSETFVRYFNPANVSQAYSRFLFECDFRGVNLDIEYICDEYEKMKQGKDNTMVAIMQNMSRNPFLIQTAISCCMSLAHKEIDTTFLKLTFTNMFAMALKGFVSNYRRELYNSINEFLSKPFYAMKFTQECIQDAMLIVEN